MYFFIFILCLNTMTSMIKTNLFFDFTGRRRCDHGRFCRIDVYRVHSSGGNSAADDEKHATHGGVVAQRVWEQTFRHWPVRVCVHCCGGGLLLWWWFIVVVHCGGSLLWFIVVVVHCCGSLLWFIVVVHCGGGSLLWLFIVFHVVNQYICPIQSCRT